MTLYAASPNDESFIVAQCLTADPETRRKLRLSIQAPTPAIQAQQLQALIARQFEWHNTAPASPETLGHKLVDLALGRVDWSWVAAWVCRDE